MIRFCIDIDNLSKNDVYLSEISTGQFNQHVKDRDIVLIMSLEGRQNIIDLIHDEDWVEIDSRGLAPLERMVVSVRKTQTEITLLPLSNYVDFKGESYLLDEFDEDRILGKIISKISLMDDRIMMPFKIVDLE